MRPLLLNTILIVLTFISCNHDDDNEAPGEAATIVITGTVKDFVRDIAHIDKMVLVKSWRNIGLDGTPSFPYTLINIDTVRTDAEGRYYIEIPKNPNADLYGFDIPFMDEFPNYRAKMINANTENYYNSIDNIRDFDVYDSCVLALDLEVANNDFPLLRFNTYEDTG